MTDGDSTLIDALKQHNPDALATVFARCSNKIYRLALSLLHDEQQADDVVQDAFVTLIHQIDAFEARSSIDTWLYRVAYNRALGHLRAQKGSAAVAIDESDVEPSCLIDWTTLPERLLTSSEAVEQMQAAIASLKPVQRAVFTLRDIEELSTRETADIVGISEGAVKVTLHRARLALREQLASYFELEIQPPSGA